MLPNIAVGPSWSDMLRQDETTQHEKQSQDIKLLHTCGLSILSLSNFRKSATSCSLSCSPAPISQNSLAESTPSWFLSFDFKVFWTTTSKTAGLVSKLKRETISVGFRSWSWSTSAALNFSISKARQAPLKCCCSSVSFFLGGRKPYKRNKQNVTKRILYIQHTISYGTTTLR